MAISEKLAIDGGTPVCTERIPDSLHGVVEIGDREKQAVLNVLEKRRLFRFYEEGLDDSEATRLEARYAERLGVKHTLAVNSGTSALIAALAGSDLEPGDEVIVPAYTFIASPASVIAVRAIPILCEIDASLTLDPEDVRRCITPRTKAIMPVHMRGFPCDMDKMLEIAREHNLKIIEDVAQANGASYHGKPLGSFGEVGCFSFQQYKIITAGEGGLLATDDETLYARARTQHDCAARYWLNKDEEIYDIVGEDYRLSEMSAALALAQLDRLDNLLNRFRRCKNRIVNGIKDIDGIDLVPSADPKGDAGIVVMFYTEDKDLSRRFAQALEAEGVGCGTMYNRGIPDRHIYCYWPFVNRPASGEKICPWTCGCRETEIRYSPDMCPKTLDYLGRALSISVHQRLTDTHCDQIVGAIQKVARALL